MAIQLGSFQICLVAIILSMVVCTAGTKPIGRSSFPAGFSFGTGISASSSEGAAYEDGRGPSICDTYVRKYPGKVMDRSTGDVGAGFYHHYKEDVKLLKKIGVDSFKFSISWSRVLPKGKISGGVNPLGVKFYNDLIDELLANGIKPFVILLYFDTPQALEDEYDGLLSPNIVKDFENYADFCFKTFGDRVKKWITVHDPTGFSYHGYADGSFAPGRCSSYIANCSTGNSATEPYIAGHHLLLSHAAAVKLYKQKYQATQKGQIGITILSHWFVPKNNTLSDIEAASRGLDYFFGWFGHPVVYGDYPKSIRSIAGDRLPKFTEAESKLVKGSFDFLGLNYFTTNYLQYVPLNPVNTSFTSDRQLAFSFDKNGVPIGTPTSMIWLYNYPKGFRNLLLYIKKNYKNPPIYISENGMGDSGSWPIQQALNDTLRIKYHHDHLSYLLKAIKDGANVKGYHTWSFLDDFAYEAGYSVRSGLTFVDHKNNLKRYPKDSAYWLSQFLRQ
ncbi:hypothetical protein HS088_TW01G00601 [Tripterygium wilfordii]|uniref:Beta-glucosidase 12-like n=1 Tax=Tripterygium wilfordii TaxID=458696 RepID=A0A7J7E264_TRIWF|nr:beta-glucosidase 12-like [Tripterygium wilfordii]KAF5752685.1 hypothetical protein HS088_TW01G00601 [Tripterygium wilfordii]